MSVALNKIIDLEDQSTEIGFAWPDVEMILEQIVSECQEVRQALQDQESQRRVQEEVGDVLHAAICLCVFLKFDIEQTFSLTAGKFEKRLLKLQEIAIKEGHQTLKGQSMQTLLHLWDLAKKET